MKVLRKKWARRLGAVFAVVIALVGMDAKWPKPLAIVAYRAGLYAWFAESPSYHKEIAVSLFSFAGWRDYAPAQVAMFHAHLKGEGASFDLVRAVMWLRGADSQGYLPVLYHRSWFYSLSIGTLDSDVEFAFQYALKQPKNASRSKEAIWADSISKVHRHRIYYPLILRLAIDAGDPFAPATRDEEKWQEDLIPGELLELQHQFDVWRKREVEPLPKNAEMCVKLRRELYPVLSAGFEISRRCLEAYRREPETEAQWKAFFACAAKFYDDGFYGTKILSTGLDGAIYVLTNCDSPTPET